METVTRDKRNIPTIIVHHADPVPGSFSCCNTSDEEEENTGCAMQVGETRRRSGTIDLSKHTSVQVTDRKDFWSDHKNRDNGRHEYASDDISASLYDMKNNSHENTKPESVEKPEDRTNHNATNGFSNGHDNMSLDYRLDLHRATSSHVQDYNSYRELNNKNRAVPELPLTSIRASTDEDRPRSGNTNLTRYSSPRDVLKRVTSRRTSREHANGGKSEDVKPRDSSDIERLQDEVYTKTLTIKSLQKELQRVQTHKIHLEQQLCESDNFIEKKVSELSRKSDDSYRHWQTTQEENIRLRQDMEAKESVIGNLRDQIRLLEMKMNQSDAQILELKDKLQVANEVVAAHHNQNMRVMKNTAFPDPLKHENELLRQQLERQEREITLLRRELGPSRLILDVRNRQTATDKLSLLLQNMETTAEPTDMSDRHEVIIQRAKEALHSLEAEKEAIAKSTSITDQLIEKAFEKPLQKTRTFQKYDVQLNNHSRHPIPPEVSLRSEQHLYDYLNHQEQLAGAQQDIISASPFRDPVPQVEVPEVLTDSYEPHEITPVGRRSPSVERLLAKYRGGPTYVTDQHLTDDYAGDENEDEGDESPRPDVTVYSLGRKIHDADQGRQLQKDEEMSRVRHRSADHFIPRTQSAAARYTSHGSPMPDDNLGLWGRQSNQTNYRPSSRSPSVGARIESSTLMNSIRSPSPDRFDAKTYANSLIERYIAERRR